MDAKKYKIIKELMYDERYWYYVKVKHWYWPFWIRISPYYKNKSEAKYFLNNKDELEKNN